MPSGLKITNRYDITLYDSAWIAGVDYEDEAEETESDDESYIESESDESEDTDDDDDDDDDEDDDLNDEYDEEEAQEQYDELRFHYEEIGNENEEESTTSDDEDDSPMPGPTLGPEPSEQPTTTNPTIVRKRLLVLPVLPLLVSVVPSNFVKQFLVIFAFYVFCAFLIVVIVESAVVGTAL